MLDLTARAAGILAKTDAIDARVLVAFAEAIRPPLLTASVLEQGNYATWKRSAAI